MARPSFVRTRGLGPTLAAATAVLCSLASCDEQLPRPLNDGVVNGPDGSSGLDTRPVAPTCGQRPSASEGVPDAGPPNWDDARIEFERVTLAPLSRPIEVANKAGRYFVAEQGGFVREVFPNETTSEVVLDIRDWMTDGFDQGIQGFALHPKFPSTPYAYVSYTAKPPSGSRPELLFQSVIARFESLDGGKTFARETEKRLLVWDQEGVNHNNGCLVFGPDGYLYIGSGEGAFPSDTYYEAALKLDNLLGKILRIDVDSGDPYAIPSTNPFASGGGLPEIYAYGLRNPWRFDFDPKTGRLWAGDVGQVTWEEINEIVPGGNYGWGSREGPDCFEPGPGCDGDFIDPIIYHGRDEANALVGGVFYRGTKVPALTDKYVYGDANQSKFYAVHADEPVKVPKRLNVGTLGRRPVSFRLDENGEILVVSYVGALLRMIQELPPPPPTSVPTLAETGCVDPNDPQRPVDGLFPYDVNVGAWASGASAARYLSIPEGTTISVEESGRLVLPPGSVAMKMLSAEGRLVETQMLFRDAEGSWHTATYASTQPDVAPWRITQRTEVPLPSGRSWVVDPDTCTTCHTQERGTLGLELAQLDRDGVDYGARQGNPLATLIAVGIVDGANLPAYRPLPRIDGLATVDARARAYLHANCAFCHSGRDGDLDLRFDTPFSKTALCGVTTGRGTRLVPGQPEASTLLTVLRSEEPGTQMPPVGRTAVDEGAVLLVADFIRFTSACPSP